MVLLLTQGNSAIVSVAEILGIRSTTPESSSVKKVSRNGDALRQRRVITTVAVFVADSAVRARKAPTTQENLQEEANERQTKNDSMNVL